MLKIIHKVNTISELEIIPFHFGVEIDVRAYESRLVLHHDPYQKGEDLEKYLKVFHHAFIIFNIKEAGIEQDVIDLAKRYHVFNYFLLDVEFPYLYRAARSGTRRIAIRFSEDESIETVKAYQGLIDWVWIDTITKLPIMKKNKSVLEKFKTCVVCPERWGRPEDIGLYREQMKQLHFDPTAVMTARKYVEYYEE